ncbi:MAG: hypothetical protein KGV44_06065 [Flavobacteriaceae bacterium]|nr:hypothetical protein [Flavobacteriaceae bacterium]
MSVLNFPSIDHFLHSGISKSISKFNYSEGDANFWAETELRRNIEQSVKNYANNSINSSQSNYCSLGTPPPIGGFKITFGLQILLDYKVRFKANLNLGYGQRVRNFGATSSIHISAYNSGLGTRVCKRDLVVDITAAANVIIGTGNGIPLQSYSLNYNSPIPMLNDFLYSIRYGQLYTWNSALHKNEFSLDRLQREGMIGFRLGNIVNVSSNNDTKRAYFGGGTDMGWTGGISLVTPLFEFGFQDFSGDYRRVKNIKHQKTKDNDDDFLRKYNREHNIDSSLGFHRQTPYQKSLNKASTYIRFNNPNGGNTTIDFIGDAWLQDLIHKKIQDFRFEYNHKKTQIWSGLKF